MLFLSNSLSILFDPLRLYPHPLLYLLSCPTFLLALLSPNGFKMSMIIYEMQRGEKEFRQAFRIVWSIPFQRPYVKPRDHTDLKVFAPSTMVGYTIFLLLLQAFQTKACTEGVACIIIKTTRKLM